MIEWPKKSIIKCTVSLYGITPLMYPSAVVLSHSAYFQQRYACKCVAMVTNVTFIGWNVNNVIEVGNM